VHAEGVEALSHGELGLHGERDLLSLTAVSKRGVIELYPTRGHVA
jgi:hypothetical protein